MVAVVMFGQQTSNGWQNSPDAGETELSAEVGFGPIHWASGSLGRTGSQAPFGAITLAGPRIQAWRKSNGVKGNAESGKLDTPGSTVMAVSKPPTAPLPLRRMIRSPVNTSQSQASSMPLPLRSPSQIAPVPRKVPFASSQQVESISMHVSERPSPSVSRQQAPIVPQIVPSPWNVPP